MISTISVITMVTLGVFALRLITIYKHTLNPFHLMLGISSGVGVISVLAWMNPEWLNTTGVHTELFHWSRSLAFAALLSAAAWLIFRLKPGFARFPAFFCYLPFLILAVMPALFNGTLLLEVVFTIYQLSAFLILLLLYSGYADNSNGTVFIILSLIFAFISPILFWIPDTILEIPHYITPVPLIIAGMLAVFGYNIRFREIGNVLDENTITQDLETENI